MGPPSSGKSASLMQMKNQDRTVYLNTDLKELPFRDNFAKNVEVSNAMDILSFIQQIEEQSEIDSAVLDTITFLMDMYERQYVITASDTQKAWGQYAMFYKNFVHAIKSGSKNYAILAHQAEILE